MHLGAVGFRGVHDVQAFEGLRHTTVRGEAGRGGSQESIDADTISGYRALITTTTMTTTTETERTHDMRKTTWNTYKVRA